MTKKFCPLGFFSFYVSKQQSQVGGCHHCLEKDCALWEELEDSDGNTYGQCAILSISDSLRAVADSQSRIPSPGSQPKTVDESSSPFQEPEEESIPAPPQEPEEESIPAPPPSLVDLFTKFRGGAQTLSPAPIGGPAPLTETVGSSNVVITSEQQQPPPPPPITSQTS